MAVTDTEVANNTIYRTLENGNADADFTSPTALLTSMFSKQEILDSMQRVQQAFLLATGMITTQATITGLANVQQYDLPADSIRPRRITWSYPNPQAGWNTGPWNDGPWNAPQTLSPALMLADTWELDTAQGQWPSDQGVPVCWYENQLAQQKIGLSPTPNTNGTIGLLYIQLAATLTGAGVPLAVPDDWTPYILWGTLAELLGSDGESFDPVRADYCKKRLSEGIELANLVLGGR